MSLKAIVNIAFVIVLYDSAVSASATLDTYSQITILGDDNLDTALFASTITKVLSDEGNAKYHSPEQLSDYLPESKAKGVVLYDDVIEFTTAEHESALVYYPNLNTFVKATLVGAYPISGAILQISPNNGLTVSVMDTFKLLDKDREKVIVYIDGDDASEELIADTRQKLTTSGFNGSNTPIIVGSVIQAFQGEDSEAGVNSIRRLMAAVDQWIPPPRAAQNEDLFFSVTSVSPYPDGGRIFEGKVEAGEIRASDNVVIFADGQVIPAQVSGTYYGKSLTDRAVAGDVAEITITDVPEDVDYTPPTFFSEPRSRAYHERFVATVYVLTADEGGRRTPFFSNYRPQFYYNGRDVSVTVFLRDVEMAMPGDVVETNMDLYDLLPVALYETFALREGGRTLAMGIITEIIE